MRILRSFSYAFQGLTYTFKTQANFRIHIVGFVFMNATAYYFRFTTWEYIICLLLSSLVFCAELFNTAIEAVVDLNTQELKPLAKIAKDCAAGAVLIMAISAVIVWSIIVYFKI